MSIKKYNSPTKNQRIGNDAVYGTGSDGNVTIVSNTVISRDMYYDNLTINANISLNTNGFRIFVKNNLTINGNITTASSSTGTVEGARALASGNVSYSLGGNSGGNTFIATQLSESYKKDILTLISGTVVESNAAIITIKGGASGQNGANGVITANTSGGAGELNRNALAPGGPGTPGTAVSTAPAGGAGGVGGGVAIIVAKNILGSGSILSLGQAATVGANAVTQANGNTAPNQTLHHSVDGSAHYITGDGTHGPHASVTAPNVPHGTAPTASHNVASASATVHGHGGHHIHYGNIHHSGCSGDCASYCGGATPAGHYNHNHAVGTPAHSTHGPYTNSPPTSQYFSINGVNHTPGHRNNIGESRISHGTTTSFHNLVHAGPHFSEHNPGHGGKLPCNAWHKNYAYPVFHRLEDHNHYVQRTAGTTSHSGSKVYNGGAGGVGGSATAGANGISGGGGAIIIVTDSIANTVITSVSGGSGANSVGGVGQALIILN